MTDTPKLSTRDIAAAMDKHTDPHRPEELPSAASEEPTPLFAEEDLNGYRARWSAIQTGFIDEPRKAVEEADTLVAELMKRLADAFAAERTRLESQWDKNDRVSTEDLRLGMRRYRSFFERLLSI